MTKCWASGHFVGLTLLIINDPSNLFTRTILTHANPSNLFGRTILTHATTMLQLGQEVDNRIFEIALEQINHQQRHTLRAASGGGVAALSSSNV